MSTPAGPEWVDQARTCQELTAGVSIALVQTQRSGPAASASRSCWLMSTIANAAVVCRSGRCSPTTLMDASRVRQREAEEVFDLSERQDHGVRVSILQVLIQRRILARHHWSFRSNRWPTADTPSSSGRHGGFYSTPSALKAVQHLGPYLGRLAPPVSVLGSESSWRCPHAVHSVHRSARFI